MESLTREDKISNIMSNWTIIFMATMMGGMSSIFGEMMGGLTAVGGALASESSEKVIKKSKKIKKEVTTEVDDAVMKMISQMRPESEQSIRNEFKNNPEAKVHLKDPSFDKGFEIIQKYKDLPLLSNHLSDKEIATFIGLMKKGDKDVVNLFEELNAWMQTLPMKPGAK